MKYPSYWPLRLEELKPEDLPRRIQFCTWIFNQAKWQTSNGQYFLYFIPMNLLLVSINWKCYKDFKIVQIFKN